MMTALPISLPQRYEFNRWLRIPHFLRALIVIVVGGLILAAGLNLDEWVASPQAENWGRIVVYIGVFIAFSGVLGLLVLLIATYFHKHQSIEVTQDGLSVTRPDKKGETQTHTLKWENVAAYEIQAGSIVSLWDWSPSQSSRGDSSDLFGCILGTIVNLYFILLELFITGFPQIIKFKLKSRRSLSISGFGRPMDDLTDKILPRFLPGKKTQPGVKTSGGVAENKDAAEE